METLQKEMSHAKEYEFQTEEGLKAQVKIEVRINGLEAIGSNTIDTTKIIQKFAECAHNFCWDVNAKIKGIKDGVMESLPESTRRSVLIERKKKLIQGLLKEEGVTCGMAETIISNISNDLSDYKRLFMNNEPLKDMYDQTDKWLEWMRKDAFSKAKKEIEMCDESIKKGF